MSGDSEYCPWVELFEAHPVRGARASRDETRGQLLLGNLLGKMLIPNCVADCLLIYGLISYFYAFLREDARATASAPAC